MINDQSISICKTFSTLRQLLEIQFSESANLLSELQHPFLSSPTHRIFSESEQQTLSYIIQFAESNPKRHHSESFGHCVTSETNIIILNFKLGEIYF